jgi:radical SAM protein with 4Fe4S-binding SPASM domain
MKLATKKERKSLFKNMRQKKRAKRLPFSIMFELTYDCNFKCPHCYLGETQEKKKKELTTKQIKKILDELADIGVYRIGFTGGEALMRKDIFTILNYANKKGFRFGLLTNGYFIDEKIADKLKKTNVDKVDITFNAINSSTFSTLTGVKDSYKKVFKAVNLLLERDMQVSIKSTITGINKDEIEQVGKFAREKNIRYNIDGEVLPCRGGCNEWVEKYSVEGSTVRDLRKKVYPEMFAPKDGVKRKPSKSKRTKDKVFNCGVGAVSFSLNPYGQMNFCLEIDYPEIDTVKIGIKKAWNKLKKEVDKIENIAETGEFVCAECDLLSYCGWCAGRSFIEQGSFNECSEYFKQRAISRRDAKEKK